MRLSDTETRVAEIPDCQFPHPDDGALAEYDGKTRSGPWAYMCEDHFLLHGTGLGVGRGQKLVLISGTEIDTVPVEGEKE